MQEVSNGFIVTVNKKNSYEQISSVAKTKAEVIAILADHLSDLN